MAGFDPEQFYVRVGARVMTVDGEMVGRVAQVLPEHFRVDAPMERDYWLSKAALSAVDEDIARLDFNREQLDAFKVPEPTVRSSSPILDAQLESDPPSAAEMSTNSTAGSHSRMRDHEEWDDSPPAGKRRWWLWLMAGVLALAGVAGAAVVRRRRKPRIEERQADEPTTISAVVVTSDGDRMKRAA